ncbi:MAG TPA: hypothetical protein VKR82_17365 [Candidatus Acidoferrales bacterium]|nr:hypothetical protein [Candidatus Acidoferrales bacterium]
MSDRKLQVGQVWKHDKTGKSYLVTRLYNEALGTIAILRSTEDDKAQPVRVKVSHAGRGLTLPGYSPAQTLDTN